MSARPGSVCVSRLAPSAATSGARTPSTSSGRASRGSALCPDRSSCRQDELAARRDKMLARRLPHLVAMKILLALDGSAASAKATRAVAERPWPKGSTVRVLSVAQLIPPVTPFFNEVAIDYERLLREFMDAANQIAARAADELEAAG